MERGLDTQGNSILAPIERLVLKSRLPTQMIEANQNANNLKDSAIITQSRPLVPRQDIFPKGNKKETQEKFNFKNFLRNRLQSSSDQNHTEGSQNNFVLELKGKQARILSHSPNTEDNRAAKKFQNFYQKFQENYLNGNISSANTPIFETRRENYYNPKSAPSSPFKMMGKAVDNSTPIMKKPTTNQYNSLNSTIVQLGNKFYHTRNSSSPFKFSQKTVKKQCNNLTNHNCVNTSFQTEGNTPPNQNNAIPAAAALNILNKEAKQIISTDPSQKTDHGHPNLKSGQYNFINEKEDQNEILEKLKIESNLTKNFLEEKKNSKINAEFNQLREINEKKPIFQQFSLQDKLILSHPESAGYGICSSAYSTRRQQPQQMLTEPNQPQDQNLSIVNNAYLYQANHFLPGQLTKSNINNNPLPNSENGTNNNFYLHPQIKDLTLNNPPDPFGTQVQKMSFLTHVLDDISIIQNDISNYPKKALSSMSEYQGKYNTVRQTKSRGQSPIQQFNEIIGKKNSDNPRESQSSNQKLDSYNPFLINSRLGKEGISRQNSPQNYLDQRSSTPSDPSRAGTPNGPTVCFNDNKLLSALAPKFNNMPHLKFLIPYWKSPPQVSTPLYNVRERNVRNPNELNITNKLMPENIKTYIQQLNFNDTNRDRFIIFQKSSRRSSFRESEDRRSATKCRSEDHQSNNEFSSNGFDSYHKQARQTGKSQQEGFFKDEKNQRNSFSYNNDSNANLCCDSPENSRQILNNQENEDIGDLQKYYDEKYESKFNWTNNQQNHNNNHASNIRKPSGGGGGHPTAVGGSRLNQHPLQIHSRPQTSNIPGDIQKPIFNSNLLSGQQFSDYRLETQKQIETNRFTNNNNNINKQQTNQTQNQISFQDLKAWDIKKDDEY